MQFRRLVTAIIIVAVSLGGCKQKDRNVFYESGRSEAPVKEVPKDILATQQAFTNLVNGGVRSFFRAVYFLPVITSAVAVAFVWRWLYDGQNGWQYRSIGKYLIDTGAIPEIVAMLLLSATPALTVKAVAFSAAS